MRISDWSSDVCSSDCHLASEDCFDVATHPSITFVSTKVERDGDDWAVTGDLTIKGVTKPVTVPFEFTGSAQDPFGNIRVGFEGEIAVNRKDWGLSWNAALETGGVLVSEKIKLKFDRSEEHTSELQSLMRISYAVFCLKKQIQNQKTTK